jgi:2-polyprenyl-6-methoxyphenol hydroxylase-like FAD-dependent oxidoreductase
MLNNPKILVVGAGIAGPAVCYWLKKFGFSPVLIEKSAALRKGGQALDIRGVATTLSREMGIYDQLYQMRTRIRCGRYIDTTGKTLHEMHGENFGFRQDDEIEILRGDLVETLMNLIPDVPCYYNQWIVNLQQNHHHVTVEFNNGKVETYDLVIAADGIHSNTRHMVFTDNEFELVYLNAFLSTFTIPNYLNLSHTDLQCEAHQKII